MVTVTPCGSAKFKPLVHEICDRLTQIGFLVFEPPLHDMSFSSGLKPDESLLAWKGATYAHLQRVAKGDICLLVNPGGYVGAGGTLELGFAVACRKIIVALSPDAEPARQSLVDFTLDTEDAAQIAAAMSELFLKSRTRK